MMFQEITIGRHGAITIPAKFRKKYGLQRGDKLIIEDSDQGLKLRPAVSMPIEFYTEERVAEFQEEDAVLGKSLDALGIE